jgi:crotonobetaine/carnitine-CoA ligase
VLLTERMLLASAVAAGLVCDAEDGDAFLVWEPLVHIGGAQLIPLALIKRIRLVIVERFSASRFWDQIRAGRVTKLHYLGGIIDILLKRPESPDDRTHPVKLAFGAGCRPSAWRRFEERFGIPVREVYGLTEASSFTTVNRDGVVGSIGRPLPGFEVALLDGAGSPVPDGRPGEIVLRPREAGLLTGGYLGDPEATAALFRDGALRTGDLATRDPAGNLFYKGRLRDSIRRRGVLISAWEVEAAINAHPEVSECAVVGVPAEIGEEEILAFVLAKGPAAPKPEELADWCARHLAKAQIPRFWCPIDSFPRTPSHRIDKRILPRDPAEMVDLSSPSGLNS